MKRKKAAAVLCALAVVFTSSGGLPFGGLRLFDTAVTASASDTEAHNHDEINFEFWDKQDSLPTTAGNYCLINDVTLSGTWTVPSGETNLCLNGHTIRQSGTGSVILLDNADQKLTVYDDGTTGTITGGNTTGNGGGVNITAGTFTLKGGVIEGNVANNGAGVSIANSGFFIMSGGTIQYNCGYGNTGGVLVMNNNFTMNGGTIQYNVGKNFGGIGIAGSQPNMCGTAIVKDNVIFSNVSATNTKITKNDTGYTLAEGGTPCDIKHATANGLKINIIDKLERGSQLGIFNNNQTNSAFTNGYKTYNPDDDPTDYFFCNDSTLLAVCDANKEAMLSRYCTVTWKDEDGTVLETDENVLMGTIPEFNGTVSDKAEDENYTYTFGGWSDGTNTYGVSNSLPAVSTDVTYTVYFTKLKTISYQEATWDETKNKVVYSNKTAEHAIVLDAYTKTFEDGKTYVADSNVTISSRIAFTGDVKLILCDRVTFTAGGGMAVKPSDSITIYAQEAGTGTLIANGGIGGISNNSAQTTDNNGGTISIHGGVINATGWTWGAGIGAGVYGAAGTVNIYGGKITATGGGSGGAGIGGGVGSSSNVKQNSFVNIYGGYVTATGRGGGSGIGGGAKWHTTCDGATVKILGGTVIASGQVGIGAGKNNSNHKTLEIGKNAKVYNSNVTDYTTTASVQPYATGPAENVANRYGTMKVVFSNDITVDPNITNGTVTSDFDAANEGETVTLTVTPDEGYELVSLTVKDENDNELLVNDNKFTMPASTVTVSAVFTSNDPAYTITIPAEVDLTGNDPVTITAEGVVLNEGQKVKVTLSAASNTESGSTFNAKTASGNSVVKYTINNGEIGVDESNKTVAEFTANGSKALTFAVTDKSGIKAAGKHTEILTFTVGLDGN